MNKAFVKSELFLIKNDKLLAPVIKKNGHLTFSNKKTDAFNELIEIVISQFISNMSNDFPVVYGVLSIILAVTLAILAAFVRKLFSDYRDKKKKSA